MPKIGDTKEAPQPTKQEKRNAERARNQLKNERRRQAKLDRAKLPKDQVEHAEVLRSAFGGAFGKAPTKTYNAARVGTTAEERPEWLTAPLDAGLYDDDVDDMIDDGITHEQHAQMLEFANQADFNFGINTKSANA